MKKIKIDTVNEEILRLEEERDSVVFERWPINKILDKAEKLDNEIFKLKIDEKTRKNLY